MATKKSYEERIEELKKRQAELKAQEKKLRAKQSAQERKERTKRLIAIGAEVEHYAGCQITDLEAFKKYLEKYGYAIANTQDPEKKLKFSDWV